MVSDDSHDVIEETESIASSEVNTTTSQKSKKTTDSSDDGTQTLIVLERRKLALLETQVQNEAKRLKVQTSICNKLEKLDKTMSNIHNTMEQI